MKCTDAETYGTCSAGERQQYNLDPLLDVNRYADIDSNAFVVGSRAYYERLGLPVPDEEDEESARDGWQTAGQQPSAVSNQQSATASSSLPGLSGPVVVLLLLALGWALKQ
jgi:hypothetical protein